MWEDHEDAQPDWCKAPEWAKYWVSATVAGDDLGAWVSDDEDLSDWFRRGDVRTIHARPPIAPEE